MHAELVRIIAMAVAERLAKRSIPFLPFLQWPGMRRLFYQFVHRVVKMTVHEITHCFDLKVQDRFQKQRNEFELARVELMAELSMKEVNDEALEKARERVHTAVVDLVSF